MKHVRLLLFFAISCAVLSALSLQAFAGTNTVSPTLSVGTGYSLSVTGGDSLAWGSQAAGNTVGGTIQVEVSANTTWDLYVQSSDGYPSTGELTNDNAKIPSSCFTFTSTRITADGSGTSGPSTFDAAGKAVWTGGTPGVSSLNVAYNLQIPAAQPPGNYWAEHTYILCPTS